MSTTELFTEDGARRVQELLTSWPDATEQADARKVATYWDYFERKRKAFDGTFAFGVRGADGEVPAYVAVTFGDEGAASVRAAGEAEALDGAKLAIVASAEDWAALVAGYDIGKAMTYHKLPLRVGSAATMLRNAYLVHELIVIFTRVAAGAPVAA
ncbi:MAG TPA: hypothetical protein VGL93_10740 [Streptosporangiaceae bacterium]